MESAAAKATAPVGMDAKSAEGRVRQRTGRDRGVSGHVVAFCDAAATLLETASQAIVAFDPGRKIVVSNQMASEMFGYTRQELIESRINRLLPEIIQILKRTPFVPDSRNRLLRVNLDTFARRKHGRPFPVEVSLSRIHTNGQLMTVAFVSDVSERRKAEAAQRQTHEELRILNRRLMTIQDEERKRISRELHDVFSQELVALSTELRILQNTLPLQKGAAARKLENVAQRMGSVAADIHTLSRRLYPSILVDFGLAAAVRAECSAFSRLYRIRTSFASRRIPRTIAEDVALCLYRVVQESLHNVAKHSRATKVRVRLAFKKQEIHLTVEDSGNGFVLEARRPNKGGLGLVSMNERVSFVGGTLTVNSKPGRGTRVHARIPLPEAL
jgi:PAS domain S-box-containing protein